MAPQSLLFTPLFWLGYVTLGIAAATRFDELRRWARRPAVLAMVGLATVAAAYATYGNFIALIELHDYDRDAVVIASTILQVRSGAYVVCAITLLALLSTRIGAGALDRLLNTLGTHSYGIFLIHLVVLRLALYPWLPPIAIHDDSVPLAVAKTLTCWIACIALSTALVAMLTRVRWTRPLVSNRW